MNAPVPHLGEALFAEKFDGYDDSSVQTTYKTTEGDVFAAVDLDEANGWTGSGSNPAKSELGATATAPSRSTSGGFWLDTRTRPVKVDI